MRFNRLATAIAACVLTASAVTLADSRIEYKTTEGQGTSMQAILIGQGKIRQDVDKTASVILDPTAGSITMLDHSRKTFTRLTGADIDQLAKTLEDSMKQMEQAMASMPPEMREMMKGRMSGAMGAGASAAEVVETGERGTVGGKSCRIYQTKVMGKVANETCMGDASAIEIPAADRATITAAMAWSKDLAEKLSKGPLGRIGSSVPFRGGLVPLRTTTFGQDGSRSTSEFSGVTTGAIPAEAFAVPAGYAEQKMQLPGRGRGGRP